jgi:glycosyltransferase EpsD
MKRVLFVATVVKKHVNAFHIPYLKWFKDNNYIVDVCASNDYKNKDDLFIPYCDNYFDYSFSRFPFSLRNFFTFFRLKNLLQKNQYDIIHCHTPVGGVLTRLAHSTKNKAKLIYTAHGFHFYKGASIFNNLIYYPIEKLLSKKTDLLITMNSEDFNNAIKFQAKKIVQVNGVGFSVKKINFNELDKIKLKKILNIPLDHSVVISVGELSKRKNHQLVIKALSKIDEKIVYIICGEGKLRKKLEKIARRYNVNLKLLGHRNDVFELIYMADLFVFPSLQEGLPVSLLEAMNSRIPIIASKIRGNIDLLGNVNSGFLVNNNFTDYSTCIRKVLKEKDSILNVINYNWAKSEEYTIEKVVLEMEKLYQMFI